MSARLHRRRRTKHLGDWERATRDLTLAQMGALERLADAATGRCGLDPDEAKLRRVAGADATEWRRVRKAVLGFFGERDGLLFCTLDDDPRARAKPVNTSVQAALPLPSAHARSAHARAGKKVSDFKAPPRAPTRADLLPIKNQNPAGVVGVSAAGAAGSAGMRSQPAAPGEPRASPGARKASSVVSILGGRKPPAASVGRGVGELAGLARPLGRVFFNRWIAPLEVRRLADGKILVVCPDAHHLAWVKGHYSSEIRVALGLAVAPEFVLAEQRRAGGRGG